MVCEYSSTATVLSPAASSFLEFRHLNTKELPFLILLNSSSVGFSNGATLLLVRAAVIKR